METKYYVYEIDGTAATWMVLSLLVMISAGVAAFTGYLEPWKAFAVYLFVDALGTVYLGGRRRIGTGVDVYGEE